MSIPTAVYAFAIAVADQAPNVSLAIYALSPVLYFVAITVARRKPPPGSVEQNLT